MTARMPKKGYLQATPQTPGHYNGRANGYRDYRVLFSDYIGDNGRENGNYRYYRDYIAGNVAM